MYSIRILFPSSPPLPSPRMVDSTNPRKAAYYYLATAELHETEEKFRDAANAVKSAVNMWARAKE